MIIVKIFDMINNNVYSVIFMIFLSFLMQYIFDLSILSVGGFILIIGSYYIYQGNIYFSVMAYTTADICWIINAIQHKDIFGGISIFIGILSGLIVMVKMNTNIFTKSIKNDKGKKND